MRRALSFLVLCLPLVAAPAAEADQITITGGSLYAAGWFVVSPPSTATGTDGFRLDTTLAIGSGSGRIDPLGFCDGGSGCAPGVQLNVGGHLDAFDGGLINTTLQWKGEEYEVFGFDTQLQLRPTGIFTVPEFGTADTVTVTAPFTLTGFFTAPTLPESIMVRGSGIATIKLMRAADPDLPGWERQSVRYDFENPAVVPEPASMLLLGSGLLALCRVRGRRHG
jgi:hypothetical protein